MGPADPQNSLAPRSLGSLAVLRCAGPDAVSFLQGQLTCDVARLDATTGLAALATPQGRVIAVLRLRLYEDAIHMLLPRALLPPVATRLRRYLLRARAELTSLEDWAVKWTESSGAGHAASSPALAFEYPDGRVLVAGPGDVALEDPLAESDWTAADIAAGLPQVTPATSEHFVPQMLNLDRLQAISFTKGCYTGQEIVARTQNLGRIKRRTLRYGVRTADPLAPLTALHADGTKVGEVLMSARAGPGVELLAVVALEARDRPLRTADGHTVLPLPLPYAL